MAIIGTIRKHSALAVIIVGVAIAAFVIGDFGQPGNNRTTDIGSVNGEEVPYIDFNRDVEENLEYQRKNTGEEKISEEMGYNVRQSTWDNLVNKLVMSEELDKLGMTVTADELFELVQGNHPHRYILQYFKDPATGMYNPEMVRHYLRNLNQMEAEARTQWFNFEKAIKEDQMQQKFNTLVAKSYYIPSPLLKGMHELQNSMLHIRYISPGYYTIADSSVTLTDADYQKFYDKNKVYFFNEEPYSTIEYISFEVKPSQLDRQNIAKDVQNLYQDFVSANDPLSFAKANSDDRLDTNFVGTGVRPAFLDTLLTQTPAGSFLPPFQHKDAWYMAKVLAHQSRPDSMHGAQILVTWSGLGVADSITRTQAQAKTIADSLLKLLRTNPGRFAEVAKQASDYPTAKQDGGELPWFPDGNPNVAPFFEAGISMQTDEVKIIETRLGYSLFKLTEKAESTSKIKAAVLQRNIEPSLQTFQDYYNQASAFAGKYKTPQAFDTGAVAEGVFKRQAQNVKEMDYTIQGLQNARATVRWCFAEPTKVGEVSHVFDLQDRYVVVLLKERFDKGYQPLDKIKERIEPNVKNQKKIEMMASRVAEAMKNQPDLTALGAMYGAKVDTVTVTFSGMNRASIARENEVMGTLFSSPANQLLGPIQGNFGLYVVVIDQIIEASATDNYANIERSEMQGWQTRVSNSLLEALKKQAAVEDNRILFY